MSVAGTSRKSTRCWRQKLEIQNLVLFLLNLSLCSEALAHWRVNQRSHPLDEFRDDELATLSRKTDISGIRTLLQPILVERIVGTPQHDRVAHYLKQKAEQYGFTTEWNSFDDNTPMGRKTFHNVIATYDPMVHRRLVLACHYDSKILPGQVFIAATDSAVPCALILDVAKTLGPLLQSRTNKHITLQLIFLDGEEAFHEWSASDSIYGARHLAESWANKWYPSSSGSAFELGKEIDRIDVMMLLDLLGASDPFPQITSSYGHGTTELFQQLPQIEKRLRQLSTLRSIPNIFREGTTLALVEDDHVPFMQRGVPVMHLISVPFPKVWHTPRDNEAALNYDVIYNLASVIRVFVAGYLGVHPIGPAIG